MSAMILIHAAPACPAALARTFMLGHLVNSMTDTYPHRFTVLLAGRVEPSDRLRDQVCGTRVIAADGGIAHAQPLDVEPELWVGDFDSAQPHHREMYAHLAKQSHPSAKAETDGSLAITQALALGAQSIVLAGAFGGRTDHTFAVMTQAVALAASGVEVVLTCGREEATPLGQAPQTFDYPAGTVFSVLAFSDLVGLTLSGVRWPLDQIDLTFGSTLTLSNEVTQGLTASLKSGRALLLAQLPSHER